MEECQARYAARRKMLCLFFTASAQELGNLRTLARAITHQRILILYMQVVEIRA